MKKLKEFGILCQLIMCLVLALSIASVSLISMFKLMNFGFYIKDLTYISNINLLKSILLISLWVVLLVISLCTIDKIINIFFPKDKNIDLIWKQIKKTRKLNTLEISFIVLFFIIGITFLRMINIYLDVIKNW